MAFFQETRPQREPFLNAPSSVLWLIGVLVAVHMARTLAPTLLSEEILFHLSFLPARYAPGALAAAGLPPTNMLEMVGSFLSHIFLHGSFAHLAINCMWLLAFGPGVARRLGTPRFLAFFFFCGVVAASVHLAVNWGSPAIMLGASGAVAGLMGAGMRILYGSRHLPFIENPPLAPIGARPILFFTASWVAVNLLFGFTSLGLSDAPIAWAAHLGGYFSGLVTIGMFDRRTRQPVFGI